MSVYIQENTLAFPFFFFLPTLSADMLVTGVAIMSTYLQLSEDALVADQCVLHSPPTNALYGIYSAIRRRHLFFGVLSFVTLLAELGLPGILSHVPFSKTETHMTQLVCTWLAIGIVRLMMLTLAASFLITWPHLPVDPRTIAGAIFYVCESDMLEMLGGCLDCGKKTGIEALYRWGADMALAMSKSEVGGQGWVLISLAGSRQDGPCVLIYFSQSLHTRRGAHVGSWRLQPSLGPFTLSTQVPPYLPSNRVLT